MKKQRLKKANLISGFVHKFSELYAYIHAKISLLHLV
jgi:hypothetical protein